MNGKQGDLYFQAQKAILTVVLMFTNLDIVVALVNYGEGSYPPMFYERFAGITMQVWLLFFLLVALGILWIDRGWHVFVANLVAIGVWSGVERAGFVTFFGLIVISFVTVINLAMFLATLFSDDDEEDEEDEEDGKPVWLVIFFNEKPQSKKESDEVPTPEKEPKTT